jgi:drug/metabolite transporter (DMT)-like permease
LRAKARVTWGQWWPFALLTALSAARWVVSDAHPEAESTLLSKGLGCGWATLLALALMTRAPAKATLRRSWRGLAAGALLLCGPAVWMIVGARSADASGLTMALALTSVVVAVAATAFGSLTPEGVAGRIWPGLAAIAGLLLLLAEPSLADTKSDVALALAPALTGIGAAWFCSDRVRSPWRATMALAGAAVVFGLAIAVSVLREHAWPEISLVAVAYDGVLASLSVLTLVRLGATRWSAQFTLLPLLILLQALVFARPPLTTRWVFGLGLLAVASVYLLLPQVDDGEAGPPSVVR